MQRAVDKLSEKGRRLFFQPDVVVAKILCLGAVRIYHRIFTAFLFYRANIYASFNLTTNVDVRIS